MSLSTDTDCLNGLGVNDLISYFEHNPLKYCVLVVDANRIKAMIEQKKELIRGFYKLQIRQLVSFFFQPKWDKHTYTVVENTYRK